MKFQPGDDVSFVNEKQEGKIIKILSEDSVLVLTGDGFEMSVSAKELVKRTSVSSTSVASTPSAISSVEEIPDIISLVDLGDIAIVTLPEKTGAVLTGDVLYYIVNRSDHPAALTFYTRLNKKLIGRYIGVLQPNTSDLALRSPRPDLVDVESFFIEALLFCQEHQHLRKELQVIVPDIQTTRQGFTGIAAFAKTISLFKNEPIEEPEVEKLKEHFKKSKSQSPANKTNIESKRGIITTEKIVDLHIEELVSDVTSLTNADMLDVQIKTFTAEMNKAIGNHYHKITFIHGVGSGVLRKAIRDELRNYPNVQFSDADPAKFGYGATDVFFNR